MDPIQPKTHKIFIWFVTIASSLVVLLLIFSNQIDFSEKIKGFEEATNNFFVQTLHSDTLMPPPLRGVFGDAHEPLTDAGVLFWTNKARQTDGKGDLKLNTTLSAMAENKLQDLFAKQYFEHESPTGAGPGDLAKEVGYDYIVIGENLALGNFNGDEALVDAWMASPGHRANILNARYQEIGIAVGQGDFEGKKTWIAVQEFGLPVEACPQPSRTDKAAIDQAKKNVDALEASLAKQKAAIENASPKYGSEYNAMVEKYNASVNQFNKMVVSLKAKITAYNKQVATFNACAELTQVPAEKL